MHNFFWEKNGGCGFAQPLEVGRLILELFGLIVVVIFALPVLVGRTGRLWLVRFGGLGVEVVTFALPCLVVGRLFLGILVLCLWGEFLVVWADIVLLGLIRVDSSLEDLLGGGPSPSKVLLTPPPSRGKSKRDIWEGSKFQVPNPSEILSFSVIIIPAVSLEVVVILSGGIWNRFKFQFLTPDEPDTRPLPILVYPMLSSGRSSDKFFLDDGSGSILIFSCFSFLPGGDKGMEDGRFCRPCRMASGGSTSTKRPRRKSPKLVPRLEIMWVSRKVGMVGSKVITKK